MLDLTIIFGDFNTDATILIPSKDLLGLQMDTDYHIDGQIDLSKPIQCHLTNTHIKAEDNSCPPTMMPYQPI